MLRRQRGLPSRIPRMRVLPKKHPLVTLCLPAVCTLSERSYQKPIDNPQNIRILTVHDHLFLPNLLPLSRRRGRPSPRPRAAGHLLPRSRRRPQNHPRSPLPLDDPPCHPRTPRLRRRSCHLANPVRRLPRPRLRPRRTPRHLQVLRRPRQAHRHQRYSFPSDRRGHTAAHHADSTLPRPRTSRPPPRSPVRNRPPRRHHNPPPHPYPPHRRAPRAHHHPRGRINPLSASRPDSVHSHPTPTPQFLVVDFFFRSESESSHSPSVPSPSFLNFLPPRPRRHLFSPHLPHLLPPRPIPLTARAGRRNPLASRLLSPRCIDALFPSPSLPAPLQRHPRLPHPLIRLRQRGLPQPHALPQQPFRPRAISLRQHHAPHHVAR